MIDEPQHNDTTSSPVGATEVWDHMHLTATPLAARLFIALSVLSAMAFGVSAPAGANAMSMTPNVVSVICDGSYGSVGRISGAGANEVLTLTASPATTFLPARSNSAGNYTMLWKCDPADAGTQWNVTVRGASSGRVTTFTVIGGAAPLPPLPPAGTNLLTNPGAETAGLAPWQVIDQSGTTTAANVATSNAQAGTRMVQASSGANSGGSVGQDVSGPIAPGQTFTYSVWARHPHAGAAAQPATIVLETIGGTLESAVLPISVTDTWQRFDVTLSVVQSGHVGLRAKVVMLTSASSGQGVYGLDSATLVESSPDPIGALERATGGTGSVRVQGFAIDPNQPHDPVSIVIALGAERTELSANGVRSDIGTRFPSAGPVHGFDAQIATANTGTWQVCAYARNLGAGADALLGCSTVTLGATTQTTVPQTTVPQTTVPQTTVPQTTVPQTTVPQTTTPTTPSTTSGTIASSVPGTFPDTSGGTTVPDPLGPQAFEPTQVATVFTASNLVSLTNASDFVEADADLLRLYWAFFNRTPDVAGAQYWIGQSRAGLSLDDIAYNFAASVEFQRRYGTVTDHEFLDILYQNVLGRRYDTAGFNYWLSLIDRGLERSQTVRWIAANTEFVLAHPYPST